MMCVDFREGQVWRQFRITNDSPESDCRYRSVYAGIDMHFHSPCFRFRHLFFLCLVCVWGTSVVAVTNIDKIVKLKRFRYKFIPG